MINVMNSLTPMVQNHIVPWRNLLNNTMHYFMRVAFRDMIRFLPKNSFVAGPSIQVCVIIVIVIAVVDDIIIIIIIVIVMAFAIAMAIVCVTICLSLSLLSLSSLTIFRPWNIFTIYLCFVLFYLCLLFLSKFFIPLPTSFNTLRSIQDGRHFADDISKCIFLNENVRIWIKLSLKFVPMGLTNNIPVLV